jgi:predicted nucleotidyltransferase
MTVQAELIETILASYPGTQALYLFGSWGTENEWPDSDVDLAVLLPPEQAKQVDIWEWNALAMRLGSIVHKQVDLINARRVSTVFQKEIIMAERRIYCADQYAADEFEMLVLSFYQKLNEERREILEEGLRCGKFYNV